MLKLPVVDSQQALGFMSGGPESALPPKLNPNKP